MAYDRGFLKVTWGFIIAGTDEIAVTSMNLSTPDDPGFNPAASVAEINMPVVGPLLIARMQTLLNSASIKWADYSRLVYVRIAGVTAAGPEVDPAKQFDQPTTIQGNDTDVLPQASVVLSLRSGSVAGSGNFGRMYLPHTSMALGSTQARASVAFTGTLATAMQTFVNGVKDDLDAAVTAAINPMIMTQVVGGTSKRVVEIALGDVNDTQRRRRNQLPEIYIFRAIP